MQIKLDSGSTHLLIRGYQEGWVRVNDEQIYRSVVVMPDQLLRDWPPRDFEELASSHFESLLAWSPEIVLLGTGARLRFPSPATTAALIDTGIGVEVMDTAAACRTYNVLASEDRRVAAALLMI